MLFVRGFITGNKPLLFVKNLMTHETIFSNRFNFRIKIMFNIAKLTLILTVRKGK